MDVGGPRLHYLDQGSKQAQRTLLFVHGNPTWSFHWRRLIQRLQGEYRCVSPDHLGCGLSDERYMLQVQRFDQPPQVGDVINQPQRPWLLIAQSAAKVVGRYAAVVSLESLDEASPVERPRRIAVDEEQRSLGLLMALIEVVQSLAADSHPSRFEGI